MRPSLRSYGDAEIAARNLLWQSLRFNTAVQAAVVRVRDEPEPDKLFDELRHELQQQVSLGSEPILRYVAEELLELTLMAAEDEIAANVHALLWRFDELFSFPPESAPREQIGVLWLDCVELRSELAAKFKYGGEEAERAEFAYWFASAYNVVVNAQIIAAAARQNDMGESIYRDAIETNLLLVGSGEGDDLGMLAGWVASQTAGSASASAKLDKDPIIYSIRRSLEEQQRALE